VFALSEFHNFVWGVQEPVAILSDHRALSYLFKAKTLHPTLASWFATICEYNFTIVHLPGQCNLFADTFSRLVPNEDSNSTTTIRRLTSHENLRVPPPEERLQLLADVHARGHFGVESMMRDLKLRHKVEWSKMRDDLTQILNDCIPCKEYNLIREGYHPLRSSEADEPFQKVQIDLVTNFPLSRSGNRYIFVYADVLSGFVVLRAIPNKKAETVSHELVKIIADFGVPQSIQVDEGKEWFNNVFNSVCSTLSTLLRSSSPDNPHTQGLVERVGGIASLVLRKICQGAITDWDIFLPVCQLHVNNRISSTCNTAPFSIVFGRECLLRGNSDEGDVVPWQKRLEELKAIVRPTIKEQKATKHNQYNEQFLRRKKIIPETIPEGSEVYVKATSGTKDLPNYDGPFFIVQQQNNGTYLLRDAMDRIEKRTFPPNLLKITNRHPKKGEYDNVHVVEEILKHAGRSNAYKYLVKWENFDESENSWIEEKDVLNKSLLYKYWKSKSKEKKIT